MQETTVTVTAYHPGWTDTAEEENESNEKFYNSDAVLNDYYFQVKFTS